MSTTPGDPDRNGDESRPSEGDRPAPPPPPGPPGAPGYGYGYGPQYPVYRTVDHPKATTALVLGLVGILGGLTCYLPLALGPWAWVIGRRAVKEIDADPQRFGGRSQAMTGYVLGIVCTVLLVLGLLAFIAFLVFAFAFSVGSGEVGGIRV